MVIRDSGSRHEEASTLLDGAEVVTFDEKHLGVVKASADGCFRVSGRWGRRDFWLNSALIRSCEPGRVRLHISRDVVDRYKRQDQP